VFQTSRASHETAVLTVTKNAASTPERVHVLPVT
jgi:hypothetical protein